MVILYSSGVSHKFHTNLGIKTLHDVSLCNNLLTSIPFSPTLPCRLYNNKPQTSSFSWKGHSQRQTCLISQGVILNRWLCRSHDSILSDNEYRSSRNIAITLFRRYRNVIDRGGGDNLKEFISAGVNAYALGCTDEGLRKELNAIKESGVEIEAMQSYGGSTSVKSKIFAEEVDECILWLSILFITILCTPQPTIVRWSSTPSVSDEILLRWKGFCALIANAYYVRGMAWLPVKTLQLEQMAVVGYAEEPSVVASRMRLVFSTLEIPPIIYLAGRQSTVAKSLMYDIAFQKDLLPQAPRAVY